jgi:hypothetical protein
MMPTAQALAIGRIEAMVGLRLGASLAVLDGLAPTIGAPDHHLPPVNSPPAGDF